MKPVDQRVIPVAPVGPDTEAGDCVRACVASILELQLDDVPHFIQDAQDGDAFWWDLLVSWASGRGYEVTCHEPDVLPAPFDDCGMLPHVMVSGPSTIGPWLHCVVYDGVRGELAHDPNPARRGLGGPPVDVIAFRPVPRAGVTR